jgi:hypothetical protein
MHLPWSWPADEWRKVVIGSKESHQISTIDKCKFLKHREKRECAKYATKVVLIND